MTTMNLSSYSLTRLATPVFVALIVSLGLSLDSDPAAQSAVRTPKSTQQPSPIKFKAARVSNGQTPDGIWFSLTKLVADDGSLAYNIVIPFDSVTRADGELRQRSKLATKIVRTSPQIDKQGKTVGQRLLALYPGAAPGIPIVKLSWTIGSTYFEINSNSMANVLELERQSDAGLI